MSVTKLFIHGFPNDMDKQERIDFIIDLFSSHIQLSEDNITIITDREKGWLKPFLFVEVGDSSIAESIIEQFDNTEYPEISKLSISLAKPKEESGNKSNNFRNKRQGGNSYSNGGSYNRY